MDVMGTAVYVIGGYSKDKRDLAADGWVLDLEAFDRSAARQARPS